MSGWRVPGYTELGELGAGAHGRVVLARHGDAGALVAIKYVGTGERTAPRVPSEREARIMASVRHPNVVRLHELVRGDTGVALVMEAVRGVPLNRLLRGLGLLEPEAALTVLKGSLLGLAAAHDAGMVHRDYKPDNVIVGDDGVSKLIDFGVASVSGESSVAGTAAYMAPEQCNGDPAGPAADVYAATCVFVECVAGRPPYLGDRDAVLMAQHLHGPIPAGLVPAPLRGLVTHGMAKSAAERPPGAAEFVAELEAVAAEEYGEDWESRGLVALAAAALALMPRGGGPAQAGTSTADSTVGTGHAAGAAGAAAVPAAASSAAAASAKDVVKDQARRSTRVGLLVLCAALLLLIGTSLYILRDHATTRDVAGHDTPPPGTSAPVRPSPTPSHGKKGGDGGSDGGGGSRKVATEDHPGLPFDRPSERAGTPCPAHAIAPYSFGSVQVGQVVTRDFAFPHRTCDDVGAMSVRGPGAGGFGALVSCPPPGTQCRFRVTFRPAERGRLYSASVVVPSTEGGTAVALRVSGTAATPVQTCPRQALPARNLGSVEAGQTVSRVLDVPLNACYDTSAVRLDGDPSFALAGTRCGGTSCQVTVAFSPTDAGARSATLVVPDRTGEAAVTVPVTAAGTRTVPSCKRGVNGPDYRFSQELEGDGRIKEPVPIPWDWCYDAGTMSLTDTSAFRLLRTSCPPPEGSSCAALVIFEPGETGTYVTTLVVRDRDGGPGVSVRVTATAVEEPCDPDPDGCPSGFGATPSEPSSGTPSGRSSGPSSTPPSIRAVPRLVRPAVSPSTSGEPAGGPKTVTPSAKPGPDVPEKPEESAQPRKKQPEKKEPEKKPGTPDTPALPHPEPSTAPPATGPTGSGRTRAVPAR
ncbi:protein kinase domain-containing protein [Actinomadura decatromicini]|uniref:non-specific serine/threonine protein kinase n=1 Tax=Actinomadura decatromicini TaxID=2604572 RepID=A0A5D3FWE7_9ACTN|nr:protein kinase [Actinomadura decatromicini]TYK52651.1 protein kinase [Actinomadura decatromicini]